MPAIKPIIEVTDLSFSYGRHPVLDDISLAVKPGDYVGIIGPNGGGKSTLLKILVGLLPLQKGSIEILGHALHAPETKNAIGYVPQRVAQDNVSFPATVLEVVSSGRTGQKKWAGLFSTQHDRAAIEQALAVAGISRLRKKLISTLSGGQRQRVYVARALARKPQILILDEPFVGVDSQAQQEFYRFLKQLNTKHGITILFVSHDIDVMRKEAKSILCLNRGMLCYGPPNSPPQRKLLKSLYAKPVTHLHH